MTAVVLPATSSFASQPPAATTTTAVPLPPAPATTSVPPSAVSNQLVIFQGPIASPGDVDLPYPAETVTPRLGPSTSPSTGGAVTPDINNQGAMCEENAGFVLLQGNGANACEQGTGGNWISISILGTYLEWLTNNSGYQVLLSQYSNGTGWTACFSHGNSYELTGTQYQSAQGYYKTNNGAECSTNALDGQCLFYEGMAWLPDLCMYSPSFYYPGDEAGEYEVPILIMTNASGYRVWMHENANNSGWADCFTNSNAYQVYGSRDDFPGNIQVSTNSSAC